MLYTEKLFTFLPVVHHAGIASKRDRICASILRFAIVLLVACNLCGQSNRAVIVGNVLDQSGSAVPNAKVTVVKQATNASTTVTTSPEGQYTVTNLEPGVYRRP